MELLKKGNELLFVYEPFTGNIEWLKEELNDNDDDDIHVSGTFYFSKKDVIRYEEEQIVFKLATLKDDYYVIKSKTIGTEFDVYIYKNISVKYKMISCSKFKNIFEFINDIRQINNDIYIDGSKSTISFDDFKKIVEQFPNNYEKELYNKARISQVLENYFDNVENYSEKLNIYREKRNLTKFDKESFYTEWDIIKYENILSKLKFMIANEEKYTESEWGKILAEIILILFPKYINFHQQVEIKMTSETSNKKKELIDFMLVKSDGCIDVLEIKKVSNIFLVSNGCDHDNHYPTSSLSKVTMQTEKYLYNITRDSLNFERQINEKYWKDYREGFKLKVVNPKGIILIGKSSDLTNKQLLDLEVIRKMYSNIVDIYNYDDVITMLENILYQIKLKINNAGGGNNGRE